jgi:hypothetical protein
MFLARVINLSKSTDKRLGRFQASQLRTRGIAGKVTALSDLFGSEYADLYVMRGPNDEPLGIYRREELEVVKIDQIALEVALADLLSVFPNFRPSSVLGKSADPIDIFTVERLVPALRKYLEAKHV